MNTRKYSATALIMALFALSACVAPTNTPGSATQTPTNGENTMSEADKAAYDGAMRLNDQSYCDRIVSDEAKKQCKMDIQDATVRSEAIDQQDASLCASIENGDARTACETEVEVAKAAQTQRENERAETQAASDRDATAAEAITDYQSCATLELPSSQKSCEASLLLNAALEAEDPSQCDLATDEQTRQDCRSAYSTTL